VKGSSAFKTSLTWVVKYSRAYFPSNATEEMLKLWRPMLYPMDRSMGQALKYAQLFLPTNAELPAAQGYELWFDEFMQLWRSFGNMPPWEMDLFKVRNHLLAFLFHFILKLIN